MPATGRCSAHTHTRTHAHAHAPLADARGSSADVGAARSCLVVRQPPESELDADAPCVGRLEAGGSGASGSSPSLSVNSERWSAWVMVPLHLGEEIEEALQWLVRVKRHGRWLLRRTEKKRLIVFQLKLADTCTLTGTDSLGRKLGSDDVTTSPPVGLTTPTQTRSASRTSWRSMRFWAGTGTTLIPAGTPTTASLGPGSGRREDGGVMMDPEPRDVFRRRDGATDSARVNEPSIFIPELSEKDAQLMELPDLSTTTPDGRRTASALSLPLTSSTGG